MILLLSGERAIEMGLAFACGLWSKEEAVLSDEYDAIETADRRAS
jgi:hypothetical protein